MGDAPDDDLEYFNELLKKGGPTWLTDQLKALGLDPDRLKASAASPSPPDGLAAFFREALAEEKTTTKVLREKLDAALDLLTPEQRTLLKSQKSAVAADPSSPPDKKVNPNPSPTPDDPPPPPPTPAAAVKRLFKRL